MSDRVPETLLQLQYELTLEDCMRYHLYLDSFEDYNTAMQPIIKTKPGK